MDVEEYKKLVEELAEKVEGMLRGGSVLNFNQILERLKDEGGFEYNETLLRDALNVLIAKGWIEIRLPVILDEDEDGDRQFSICLGKAYFR